MNICLSFIIIYLVIASSMGSIFNAFIPLLAFTRPNVRLVRSGIKELYQDGAVVDGEKIPLDIIVLATGFDLGMRYCMDSGGSLLFLLLLLLMVVVLLVFLCLLMLLWLKWLLLLRRSSPELKNDFLSAVEPRPSNVTSLFLLKNYKENNCGQTIQASTNTYCRHSNPVIVFYKNIFQNAVSTFNVRR